MSFGKSNLHCRNKKRNGKRSEMNIAQVDLDWMASTTKHRAFVMYPVHALLLDFGAQFSWKHACNGHTLVRFLHVE